MPFDKSRYPDDWKEFSLHIRYGRAKGKCELCGAINAQPHPVTRSRVVLTVAHLDYPGGICLCEIITGKKCCNPAHVLALCQRDHLRMDRKKFFRGKIVRRSPNVGLSTEGKQHASFISTPSFRSVHLPLSNVV